MGTGTSIDGHFLGWFVSSCFAFVGGFCDFLCFGASEWGTWTSGKVSYCWSITSAPAVSRPPRKACADALLVVDPWQWRSFATSSGLLEGGTNFDDLLGRCTSPRERGCLGSGPEDGLNRGKCPRIMFKIQHACLSSCGVFAAGRNFMLALGYMSVRGTTELAAVM